MHIGVPEWRRIAEVLAGEIRAGRWRDGQRLGSSTRLAERFQVHRHTLRKSLDWLRAEGLLPPRGMRVCVPRLPLPLSACSFLPEHLRGMGIAARCGLLACTTVPVLPPALRARLPLPWPGPLLYLAYEVAAGVDVLATTEAWLPAGEFTGLSMHVASGMGLGAALRQGGAAPASHRHGWVEAGPAPLLGLAAMAAPNLSLHACALALDERGQPLKVCLHHLDASRVRLMV
jgi:GntR family phosphonate transport system transcriptional regulator